MQEKWEPLSDRHGVFVTNLHCFTTDTILLANFAAPPKNAICADFGTGCGTIPLIWQIKYMPRKVYAIEIQQDACSLAKKSVQKNEFDDKIDIIHADIRSDEYILPNESMDIISCNPPYKAVGAGIKNEEQGKITARHEHSLTVEDLARSALKYLRYGGRLFICHRPERLTDIVTVFRNNRLEPKRLRIVQQRKSKRPFLFLLECRKGGAPGIVIEPTLFIENESGHISSEMEDIYSSYRLGKRSVEGA